MSTCLNIDASVNKTTVIYRFYMRFIYTRPPVLTNLYGQKSKGMNDVRGYKVYIFQSSLSTFPALTKEILSTHSSRDTCKLSEYWDKAHFSSMRDQCIVFRSPDGSATVKIGCRYSLLVSLCDVLCYSKFVWNMDKFTSDHRVILCGSNANLSQLGRVWWKEIPKTVSWNSSSPQEHYLDSCQ
jgi:hypothetical protein